MLGVPVEAQRNAAALAEAFEVAPRAVRIVSGPRARIKLVAIDDAPLDVQRLGHARVRLAEGKADLHDPEPERANGLGEGDRPAGAGSADRDSPASHRLVGVAEVALRRKPEVRAWNRCLGPPDLALVIDKAARGVLVLSLQSCVKAERKVVAGTIGLEVDEGVLDVREERTVVDDERRGGAVRPRDGGALPPP